MSKTSYLEEFSGPAPASSGGGVRPTQANPSETRAAFDEGYTCGWNDGSASVQNEESKQKVALAEAIQELKFTYFEARHHVMKSLRPVLEALVNIALPEVVASTLGEHLIECLEALANKQKSEVVICCAPESEALLQEAAEQAVDFPITIETEPTLTSTQVILHFEQGQRQIDLEANLESIREAISAFYADPDKEIVQHG